MNPNDQKRVSACCKSTAIRSYFADTGETVSITCCKCSQPCELVREGGEVAERRCTCGHSRGVHKNCAENCIICGCFEYTRAPAEPREKHFCPHNQKLRDENPDMDIDGYVCDLCVPAEPPRPEKGGIVPDLSQKHRKQAVDALCRDLAAPHKEEDWVEGFIRFDISSAIITYPKQRSYTPKFSGKIYTDEVKSFIRDEKDKSFQAGEMWAITHGSGEKKGYEKGYQEASEKTGHHFLYEVIPAERAAAVREERERVVKELDVRIEDIYTYPNARLGLQIARNIVLLLLEPKE